MTALIDAPGVYDIPAEDYHRDPVVGGSLSSSGARKLMPPSCPALFQAWREGDRDEQSDALDFGKAAHRTVLGAGDEYVVVEGTGKDPNSWRTKADEEAVQAVRDAGKTPIRQRDHETIQAMAAKLREHPIASGLLHPGSGRPEQTLVWHDGPSGVWCRALVDWLRHPEPDGRLIVVDYKTSRDADPESLSKALANWGYHQQGAWYVEGAEALGLSALPPAFVLVVQMKTPPYLVVCAQIHPDDVGRGHQFNRKARDIYRRCRADDHWPGYADDSVLSLRLPVWAQNAHDAADRLGLFELEGAAL